MDISTASMIFIDEEDDVAVYNNGSRIMKRCSISNLKSEYYDTLKKLQLDDVGAAQLSSAMQHQSKQAPVIALTKRERDVLLATFNVLKATADQVSLDGMAAIGKAMPQIGAKLRPSPRKGTRTVDNWELVAQGTMFLNGIERLIARCGQADALRACGGQLAAQHHSAYGIDAAEMADAMLIFEQVIVEHLTQPSRCNRILSVLAMDDVREIKSAWHNFFQLILPLIKMANNNSEPSSPDNSP